VAQTLFNNGVGMFFKKKIKAEEFGEAIVEINNRWCNTSLNKISHFSNKYKDIETRTFFGLWLIAVGEIIPQIIKPAVTERVTQAYYNSISNILNNKEFKSDKELVRKELAILTKENNSHISNGQWSDYTEVALEYIFDATFVGNKKMLANRDEAITRILIDYGAAIREMLTLQNDFKIV
jgi:hypothetical protein